jgi:hypothetical protein
MNTPRGYGRRLHKIRWGHDSGGVTRTRSPCQGGFTQTALFPCHAVPLRASIVSLSFDSHMPCRSLVMPRICCSESDLSRPRQGNGIVCVNLHRAVQRRHVGDLPAFDFFRQPRGVPQRLSEAYRSKIHVTSVKPSNVCRGRG